MEKNEWSFILLFLVVFMCCMKVFFCSDATHFYNRPKVPNLKKTKTETTSNMKLKSPSLGESPNAVIDILILVSNLGFPLRLII